MRSARAWLGVTFVLGLAAVASPPARSATLDTGSDATALHAYDTYLGALIAGAPAGGRRDGVVVRSVRQSCPRALASIETLPAGQVSSEALMRFGEEIGGTVTTRFLSEGAQPLRRLSAALAGLRWSAASTASAVARLGPAEHAVLSLGSAPLCRDARTLAADPRTVPSGTAAFVSRYLADAAAVHRRLGSFLAVLTRFQTPAEHAVVAQIDRRVRRFQSISKAAQQTASGRIVAALGLPSSY
jgi:hypothetical protein